MKKKLFLAGMISALALTSACGPTSGTMRENKRKIDNGQSLARLSFERLGNKHAASTRGSEDVDRVYLAPVKEAYNAASLLPAELRAPGAITLVARDAMTLEEIAGELSVISGIPHVVALGPAGEIRGVTSSAVTAQDINQRYDATTTVEGAIAGGMTPAEAILAARNNTVAKTKAAAEESKASTVRMAPNLRGSLPSVLKEIAGHFQVEWELSDGRILLRDFVTRQYQINAIASAQSSSTTIGSNGMSTTNSIASDVWTEITSGLEGLIGSQATINVGQSTGVITVTAKVADQQRIEDYIETMNATLGQQVAFNVNVITVATDVDDSNGADIDLSYIADADEALRLGSNVVSQGNLGDYNIGVISGQINLGSIVKALRSEGRTVVTNRAGGTTSNNRIMPIESLTEFPYVSEVSVSEDSDGDDTIVRSTQVEETGFQMQILPRVLSSGQISMQLDVFISEINGIKTFGSGDNMTQRPEVTKSNFSQQAVLRNGETLVLTGFDRERLSLDKSYGVDGISSFGRSDGATRQHMTTIIMITPSVLSSRR